MERNFRGKKCNENLNAVNNQTGKNQHMDKSQTFQASACVLLSHAAYQCLSWLRFPYYPRMDKGAKREIWHSFTFLVVQASPVLVFPPPTTRARWNFRGPKRNRVELGSSSQISGWASHRGLSVCLPACRVVVVSLSTHLLWLPSCLQRDPWGQDACAFCSVHAV